MAPAHELPPVESSTVASSEVPVETQGQAIENAFHAMDTNGDGDISAEELLNGVLELRAANTQLEARLTKAERDARQVMPAERSKAM